MGVKQAEEASGSCADTLHPGRRGCARAGCHELIRAGSRCSCGMKSSRRMAATPVSLVPAPDAAIVVPGAMTYAPARWPFLPPSQ